MLVLRRALPVVLIRVMGLVLASCQDDNASSGNGIFPIFGKGGQDIS